MKKIFSLFAAILLCLPMMQAAIKVHTIGDSTMAEYDESTTDKRGWGMYLASFFDPAFVTVNNRGKSGADTRGFYTGAAYWPSVKSQMTAGDYLLIQFAHNDEGNDSNLSGLDNQEYATYCTVPQNKEFLLTGYGLEPAAGTVSLRATANLQISLDKENYASTAEASYEGGSMFQKVFIRANYTTGGFHFDTIYATSGEHVVAVPVAANAISLDGGAAVSAGEVLHVRILPWHDSGEVKDSKYIGLRNVRIEGMAFEPGEEGIEEVSSSLQGAGGPVRKILLNGQIFILRGGKIYSATGAQVR